MKRGLTELRKDILTHIQNSSYPLNAKEILGLLKEKPDLSTVYRALDYLLENKLVQDAVLSENIRYYYAFGHGHCHFVVCQNCKKAREFHVCFESNMQKQIENETNYEITGHSFYFTGICGECKKKRV